MSTSDFLLLLLAQFAGGPGPRENNLVRFGLPAILWTALLVIAWSRQRQEELSREKLLVWGFGLGIARELFMFTHLVLGLLQAEDFMTGYLAPEPIEHTLTLAALVVVAAAFIRYIMDADDLSRFYLWTGLGVSAICHVITAVWWAQHSVAYPDSRFNQTWGGLLYHVATAALMGIAIILLARRRGWLRNTVLVALAFFFLGESLRVYNYATQRIHTDFCCPVANSLYILAIPLLGYVYLREQAIEKRRAEEALGSYREHLEELVEDRTAEVTQTNGQLQREIAERRQAQAEIAQRNTALAAQNAIAATTSQSLDLDTILDRALDTVMALLEIDAACVCLFDTEGQTEGLHVYRGQGLADDATVGAQQQCLCEEISELAVAGMNPVVVNVSDPALEGRFGLIADDGLQVMVSTPLVSTGRALGALVMGIRQERTFLPHELELLTAIGQQIGMAVENAHLYHEAELWAGELTLLHEVSVFLTSTFDPSTIYNQMAVQSAKLLGCPVAVIFRWSQERREAVEVASYGVDGDGLDGLHMLLGESEILPIMIAERDPVAIGDARADARVSHLWREKFNIGALLCLPVWGKGKPLGFQCIIEPEPRQWRTDEIQLVESFVNRAAVALENAYLHRQLEWAATLEERQRIAADMHDGLAQTLSYMGHRVDWVADLAQEGSVQGVAQECDHIRDTIDQASQEVRQTIASLQAAPRSRQALQDLLAEAVRGYPKTDGPAVKLTIGIQEPLFLPPDHLEQVMRVVQEAIANGARHAQARQITVCLEKVEGQVGVTVTDDGRGFDPESSPDDGRDHFGLSIMQARASRIGGRLAVDSAPGQGTRVRLTWSPDDAAIVRQGDARNGSPLRLPTPDERERS